jgi:hypothetical protein
MKPIDYRNNTWKDIQSHLHGLRASIYEAYLEHGPCTTRQLSDITGLDILTVRPRTTELLQLGFLVLVEGDSKREGSYRALHHTEALALYLRRANEATRTTQLSLL